MLSGTSGEVSAEAELFRGPQFRPVEMAGDEIDEILERCRQVLHSGVLSGGPLVAELERRFADHSGLPHAVALSSGTDALEALLRAVGVQGRTVVLPTNTFAATAFAVVRAGARPAMVDMDPATLAPSPSQVERALDEHPDAACCVLVHIGGFISDAVKEIADLCTSRGVALVEDAAHAHGSVLRGEAPGCWSAGAAYSFFATKVITSAEGGMVVTGDGAVASYVRSFRDQGRDLDNPIVNVMVGTNARMSELHAAVGLAELERLPDIVAARRRVASHYDELLGNVAGLAVVRPPDGCEPNYYKYVLLLGSATERAEFRAYARSRGLPLPSGVYDVPLHRQPVFERVHDGAPFEAADRFCSSHVALPVGRAMGRRDAEQVAAVVRDFAGGARAPV